MTAAMFTAKIASKCHTPPRLKTLPPTTAAFHAHCLQAHYQTAVWMSAGQPSPPDLDPLQYGWEKNGQSLSQVHSIPEQSVAPNEVLNIVSCHCKSDCHTALCSCNKVTITCTQFCNCNGGSSCRNPMNVRTSYGTDSASGSSDDDDDDKIDN